MKELNTWADRSQFKYEGCVHHGTTIKFGSGYANSAEVSAHHYRQLLQQFTGRTVEIGTSRYNAPSGSVGEWLQTNVTPTAIASYVGAILTSERYATRDGDQIAFRQPPEAPGSN